MLSQALIQNLNLKAHRNPNRNQNPPRLNLNPNQLLLNQNRKQLRNPSRRAHLNRNQLQKPRRNQLLNRRLNPSPVRRANVLLPVSFRICVNVFTYRCKLLAMLCAFQSICEFF